MQRIVDGCTNRISQLHKHVVRMEWDKKHFCNISLISERKTGKRESGIEPEQEKESFQHGFECSQAGASRRPQVSFPALLTLAHAKVDISFQ